MPSRHPPQRKALPPPILMPSMPSMPRSSADNRDPRTPSEHAGHMKDCCDKMQQQGQAMECCDSTARRPAKRRPIIRSTATDGCGAPFQPVPPPDTILAGVTLRNTPHRYPRFQPAKECIGCDKLTPKPATFPRVRANSSLIAPRQDSDNLPRKVSVVCNPQLYEFCRFAYGALPAGRRMAMAATRRLVMSSSMVSG